MIRGALIAQSPTTNTLSVLAGITMAEPPADGQFRLAIVGQDDSQLVTGWERPRPFVWSVRRRWDGWRGRRGMPFHLAKVTVDGLGAGQSHTLRLIDTTTGATVAEAQASTLPADPAGAANIVFGSCHALPHDRLERRRSHDFLTSALDELVERHGPASVNLWLGDQVYVDDHIARNLVATDPHRVINDYYATTWGLTDEHRASGMAPLMAAASNHYLPDDHEFWNDYPRASVTLPFHTAKRLSHHGYRYLKGIGGMPHPVDQGPWGRTAGAAYMAFQTPDPTPHSSFGRDTNPEMIIELDIVGVKVALVDTRWRRTMSKSRNPQAGFMTPEALHRLHGILDHQGPVIIGLARPLIGHVSHRGWLTEGWEAGPENFRVQYRQLWSAIALRNRAGLPTAVIAGDVHEHSVKTTADGTLAQFVCPPLYLLPSLRPSPVTVDDDGSTSRFGSLMDLKGRLVRRLWPNEHGPLHHVDPEGVDGDRGVHAVAEGSSILAKDDGVWEGLTMLSIDNDPSGPLEISCHYHLRDIVTGVEKPSTVALWWDGASWQRR